MRVSNAVSLAVLLLVLTGYAQDQGGATQMSFSELVAQAEGAISQGASDAAIPLLKEIIGRAGGLDDRDAKKSVQMARLQVAVAYANLQRWPEARQYAEEYLSGEPVTDRMEALRILCLVLLNEKNWAELLNTVGRMQQEQLSLKQQLMVNQFRVQALFNLGRYEEALKLLPGILEEAKSWDEIRSCRIMQLRCLIETGQAGELVVLLPDMFSGPLRDDVAFNLTLLGVGDQLFDREDYLNALAIYRMICPKAQLTDYWSKKQAGEADGDVTDLHQIVQQLQQISDYDAHIDYRAAQIYSEIKRYWEAVVLFDRLAGKFPESQEGKAAVFQKILVLFAAGANEEAVSTSIAYLEKIHSGLYPRLVCTRLLQYYLKAQDLDKAVALERYVDGWTKPAGADEIGQEADLCYMLGVARIQNGDYDKADRLFDRIIKLAPKSKGAEDAGYWKAMCRLFQQKYDDAYAQFMAYRKEYPRSSFAPAALFRAGVCRFGVEDYQGAQALFKSFIDAYPDDALIPEALSMYGDLLAADSRIDEALASYDRVIKIVGDNYAQAEPGPQRHTMVTPATYAVMQAAVALEADAASYASQDKPEMVARKYRQIIDWMQRYNRVFGKDADWAQGIFWIGKAQMALGDINGALDAYLDAVIHYGADPSEEGVASILYDLADIIKTKLSEPDREARIRMIQAARNRASEDTLQIRLDVLLAELNGTQADLGRTLLAGRKDLAGVPPSGLALMCRAALNQEDYSRSQELFDYFAAHFEKSPFRVVAFRLRAEDLWRQKRTDEGYDLATAALSQYGATKDTGWAALMKGRVEMIRHNYDASIKTFTMILSVSAWKGPTAAEAMFNLGEAWFEQGNYDKAFAFFQRTYLLYRAYDGGIWAAKGYLQSAECLKKLGRESAALNTYRAMLLDTYVRDLPQAQKAKDALGPEEAAGLLARTNSLEVINGEVSP